MDTNQIIKALTQIIHECEHRIKADTAFPELTSQALQFVSLANDLFCQIEAEIHMSANQDDMLMSVESVALMVRDERLRPGLIAQGLAREIAAVSQRVADLEKRRQALVES